MAYISPVSGFSSGLERGIGIARDFQRDDERAEDRRILREDRDRRRGYEEEDRAHLRKQREQGDEDYQWKQGERQLKLDEGEIHGAQSALADALARYGAESKVPPEEMVRLKTAMAQANDRYAQTRKSMRPALDKQRQKALEAVKSGNFTGHQLAMVTRRPPEDFIRNQNGLSPIDEAELSLRQAMDYNDPSQMLGPLNFLFKPEMQAGVGVRDANGETIISKEIIGLAPSPDGDGKVLPVMRVKVRRDDGAERQYVAGVTKGRSSADGDPYVSIDIGEALDRVGNLKTMAEIVNAPGMVERIRISDPQEQARTKSALELMYSMGVTPPAGKYQTEAKPLGGEIETRTTNPQGITVGVERRPKVPDPDRAEGRETQIELENIRQRGANQRNAASNAAANARADKRTGPNGKPSALRDRLAAIDAEYENGDIDEETRLRLRREALGDKSGNRRDATKADLRSDYTTQWGPAGMNRDPDAPTIEEFEKLRSSGHPTNTKVLALPKKESMLKQGSVYRTQRGLGRWNGKTFEAIN